MGAVCRSAGFTFAGEQNTALAGRTFRTNHRVINPATDLTTANPSHGHDEALSTA